MRFIGTFYTGYCGTEEIVPLIADSLVDAEKYMSEGYADYMATWEHLAIDVWETSEEYEPDGEFYESEIYEDYYAEGSWEVHEATEDELEDYKNEDEWIDIRKE